ncbi:hypothetical protein MCOR27_001727 [Pyricularia oryzae]|uniref:MMS19 nucleotide excision repair protein n=3 Tax=Pyricularia TaxID=48558 RepID=A0ABQ8NP53_PYRGI|nr:uncharacterized protein MGG_10833 [Pyricularia oryzae 70-15]KAH8837648.1 hypothetical protein MCOR01_011252 [Pyricularia oryzae]KAI6299951.1 hypothetical protein MCOR33_004236 [Pyricularia grisea]EHA53624.1 hypothetical protein MGG_10833 [Pyricularia oryzae 70-15]KAH9437666.1 hypothetical protein MCOR02_001320 [Pyricularia oryzae]KAI6253727.1 hypothetical protein MCOR19_009737 [Pyricularia oryzae]
MADFKGLALQYVLADEAATRQDVTARTAEVIKNASVKSTAILNWVQSIDPWMPAALSGSESQADNAEGPEPDVSVITRSKALEYLADTLVLLEKNLLRTDQVNLLITFFGRLYSIDHKAGIMAATKALQQLAIMKAFKPEMGDNIIQSIVSMRDDFRLQTPQTRLEIYKFIQSLLENEAVSSQLQHVYGTSGGFAIDLLQLCGHERDPNCLLQWFKSIRSLVQLFDFSADVHDEIFKTFSAYFPISLRSTATPSGVTVDDLKSSIRSCFASSHKLARLSFPFLLQKLDQGDAITIPVKTDILRTLKECLDQYALPSQSIGPYTGQLWTSLKYEVRNGEIKESIDCTLDVMRTTSLRLAKIPLAEHQETTREVSALSSFVDMVLSDSLDDLANPSYTRPAGLLLRSIMEVHARPFALLLPGVTEAINKNLREPRTTEHATALIGFVRELLDARSQVMDAAKINSSLDQLQNVSKLDSQIREPFHAIFNRFWRENNKESPDADNVTILKEVVQGFAALVCQVSQGETGNQTLLCDEAQCEQVCFMISDRVINIFQLTSSPDSGARKDLADIVVTSLRKIVQVYTAGYGLLLQRALSTIKDRVWGRPPTRNSLTMLKTLILRLSYIGCSEIPKLGDQFQHLYLYSSSVLRLLFCFLDNTVPFEVSNITLSGIFSALLHFRDTCRPKPAHTRLSTINSDWRVCTSDFIRCHPEFAVTGQPASTVQAAAKPHNDRPVEYAGGNSDIFRGYLECALYLTSVLYQRATRSEMGAQGPPGLGLDFSLQTAPATETPLGNAGLGSSASIRDVDLQDVYLHQLGDIATFVVRDLEEVEQEALSLTNEVYGLFQSHIGARGTYLSDRNDGRTNVLSLGVAQGLRPIPMASIFASESLTQHILADISTADSFPVRTQKVRDRFVTLLANKWLPKATAAGPQRDVWKQTVNALRQMLENSLAEASATHAGMRIEQYARALGFAAGAVARRDRDVEGLVKILASLPAALGEHGKQMAPRLEGLLAAKSQLSVQNHAILRPLSEQWVYISVLKPKLEQSFPITQDRPQGVVNAIAVVHVLKHMEFTVYAEDTDRITRILIASVSSPKRLADVEAALQVLRQILANKSDAVKDQLKAVVAGAISMVTSGLEQSHDQQATPTDAAALTVNPGNPALCRRLSLQLLQEVAEKIDEQLLRQYKAQISRVLATACGDPVREVRQSAMSARSSWAKLAA